jgi:hypothetical protein
VIDPTIFANSGCHRIEGEKPMLSTCSFHFLDINLFYFACWIFLNFLWIVPRVFNAIKTKGIPTFSFLCLPFACLRCKCNPKHIYIYIYIYNLLSRFSWTLAWNVINVDNMPC